MPIEVRSGRLCVTSINAVELSNNALTGLAAASLCQDYGRLQFRDEYGVSEVKSAL